MRIVDSEFVTSAVKPSGYPPVSCKEVAFVGRSNVGKSSMINAVLGRKVLAKTSSRPGKTQLINFFKVVSKEDEQGLKGELSFVDLPGYGYAKVNLKEKEVWRRMIQAYLVGRPQLLGVVLLVDIRHKLDFKDKLMQEMLEAENIPYLVVATKSDKLASNKIPSICKKNFPFAVAAFSSKSKKGVDKVLKWINEL